MITIKLPYKSTDKFQSKLIELRKQYSSVVRFVYNRLVDNIIDNKELYQYTKSIMNNIPDMNSFIILSAISESKQLFKRNKEQPNIIFGKKFNFVKRCKNKLTKEELHQERLLPLNIIADSLKQGNRHFNLNIIDENFIEFKLSIKEKYILHLPILHNNIKKQLFKLQQLNEIKNNEQGYGYSIKLSDTHIFISFEEFKSEQSINLIENRYLGIDLNPTNIGISVSEYGINNKYKILSTYQFDFSKIIENIYNCKQSSNHKNTKYWNDKLSYEILQISKRIHNISKQFNCKYIFVEELNFKFQKKSYNKSLNRLVNNLWKRNKFIQNLNKRCNINNQKLFEINPAYSSLIGNLQYDYVDSINAAIEIGRRGYEVKINKSMDKFYPVVNLKKSVQHQWKEMGIDMVSNWKKIYALIKNLKIRYRVSLDECLHEFKVFSLNNKKSLINLYLFF